MVNSKDSFYIEKRYCILPASFLCGGCMQAKTFGLKFFVY